ncbi:hypothetical protein LCQ52_05880 [Bifidobacterium longum subsp. longum]|uniref:MATE family efflux transporter n=1 Tax=Bifidobacterium longum TaxID=216816 RepID=UPI001CE44646|nr:MATE family efflux transporter [Bifidobacterium longum]UCH54517.1 hypothetical protein LCQ52_05880 [Bifidobacterium longum subsp. longum]
MVQANTIDAGLGTKPVPRLALTMSVPTIVAQAANASYTIIDRLFIGHIPEVGNAAMTGVGICFPILLAVTAFASLIGAGGAPRASIELGRGNFKKAERILGTSAAFLIAIALTLTVLLQLAKPLWPWSPYSSAPAYPSFLTPCSFSCSDGASGERPPRTCSPNWSRPYGSYCSSPPDSMDVPSHALRNTGRIECLAKRVPVVS